MSQRTARIVLGAIAVALLLAFVGFGGTPALIVLGGLVAYVVAFLGLVYLVQRAFPRSPR